MNYFQRKEVKYLMTSAQAEQFYQRLREYLREDAYSPYAIASLYFDTEDDQLMNRCMDKPAVRQKIRLRSYGPAADDSPVFFEIKKKVKGVTCKKREEFLWQQTKPHLNHLGTMNFAMKEFKQIQDQYDLQAKYFISYYRYAWYWKSNPDVRITFDTKLLVRYDNLQLDIPGGEAVLDEDVVLMEIKAAMAIPYPISKVLNELKIYPCSFSKAGWAFMHQPKAESAVSDLKELSEAAKREEAVLLEDQKLVDEREFDDAAPDLWSGAQMNIQGVNNYV